MRLTFWDKFAAVNFVFLVLNAACGHVIGTIGGMVAVGCGLWLAEQESPERIQ